MRKGWRMDIEAVVLKIKDLIIGAVLCLVLFSGAPAFAGDGFTQKDRELLIELRVKMGEIDKRFEQVDKRFEQVDKRISELREDMNRRFGQMITFMWMLVVIFVGMTGSTIGFAIWDRRTMIRPFEVKVKEIEEKIKEMDEGRLAKLIHSLKEIASVDSKVAEALKKFNLL